MANIERKPVNSSHIHSIGYDADQKQLHVAFKNKKGEITAEGHYADVPVEKFATLMLLNDNGGSVGEYLHQHIKTAHQAGKPLHTWVKKEK